MITYNGNNIYILEKASSKQDHSLNLYIISKNSTCREIPVTLRFKPEDIEMLQNNLHATKDKLKKWKYDDIGTSSSEFIYTPHGLLITTGPGFWVLPEKNQ